MTKNGRVILEIINNSYCHPTADEVYRTAHTQGQGMSMATVYNNLNRLCDDGVIRRLTNPDQPDRFDRMLRHDHLLCTKCGKISDLYLKDRSAEIEEEAGIKMTGYDLTVHYVCADCRG